MASIHSVQCCTEVEEDIVIEGSKTRIISRNCVGRTIREFVDASLILFPSNQFKCFIGDTETNRISWYKECLKFHGDIPDSEEEKDFLKAVFQAKSQQEILNLATSVAKGLNKSLEENMEDKVKNGKSGSRMLTEEEIVALREHKQLLQEYVKLRMENMSGK